MQKRIADYSILYSGSVKNVRTFDESTLIFEFTDRVSVFDWGPLPDLISEKGQSLADIGISFFENLSKPETWRAWADSQGCATWILKNHSYLSALETLKREGLSTHFRGILTENNRKALLVEKVKVVRPEFFSVDGKQIPVYSRSRAPGELIPLEVVFRHEIVSGSSVLKRDSSIHIGDRFEKPLIEFYTKLESQDRYLGDSEAFMVSGLGPQQFEELKCKTVICSIFLKTFFEKINVRLIDGKLEWAIGRDGRIMLVDSIGPDELRILKNENDISKEILREFYRKTEWYSEVAHAKTLAKSNWKRFVKSAPEPLPKSVIDALSSNYKSLALDIKKAFEVPASFEKVFLYGSGAREHALALAILKSNGVTELVWATTNLAAADYLKKIFTNKKITILDCVDKSSFSSLAKKLKVLEVTLAVIGPDQALADGITDAFLEEKILVFGPTKAAACLEWSKSFSKHVMKSARVPTARSFELASKAELLECLHKIDWNCSWVLKADGLALGKGVVICGSIDEALRAAETLSQFGNQFVVEEFLTGREVSMFALCDGETCSYLGSAQDYKTLFDRQKGPNTGGMGAVSPAPNLSVQFENRILEEVFLPVVREMKNRGTPYVGVLYAGLMVRGDEYWVLEFNSRFGDPETQALLPRVEENLVSLMKAAACGTLNRMSKRIKLSQESKYYVVIAAKGYPDSPVKGSKIAGLSEALYDSIRFAGVKYQNEYLETSGGRVLGVLADSKRAAYDMIRQIRFDGMQYRTDVGGATPRILVLASGRGSNFEAILKAVHSKELDAQIVALGCNREKARVFEIADQNQIESFLIRNEKELQEKIKTISPDYVVLAGYDRILNEQTVNLMRSENGNSKIINIHPSLLPAFKGLHAYRQAFEAKVKVTGVSVHRVEPELDAGPILAQKAFSIENCNSVAEVETLGLSIEHELYSKALNQLFSHELTRGVV